MPVKGIPEADSFEGIPGKARWQEETPEQTQELLKGLYLPAGLRASCPFNLTLVITKIMHVWIIPGGKFEGRVKERRRF